MPSNYKRLGDFIREVNIRNTDLKIKKLIGVSIEKKFINSVANIVGTDMSVYKIINKNQLACKLMSVGRDEKLPVDLYANDDPAIISSAYYVFESISNKILLPEYLKMWLFRSETDRYVAYVSGGDVRGGISWDTFCDMPIVIPHIDKQSEIVREYNIIQNRIKLNNQLITKLEETAQAIYKQWFVDFEFPDANGNPYKSNAGEMVWCEELEKEIPKGWITNNLSSYAKYSNKRISITDLIPTKYISTENMLRNKKGIEVSDEIPDITTALKFVSNDILISNIRPYLKKIWFADFEGGCSNDVLCIETLNKKDSYFIYNSLEQDCFFDYVMAGSKGTKMPRGDKQWIMDFTIVLPDLLILNKFSDFSEKAMNHRKISEYENHNLEELKNILQAKMTKVEREIEIV